MNGMDPTLEMGGRLAVNATGPIVSTVGSRSVECILQSIDMWEGLLRAM